MLYIIILILFLFLTIYLVSGNKSPRNSVKIINNQTPVTYQQLSQDIKRGRCKLKINNNFIKPFMFKNLSNSSISNENINWNLECIDSDRNLYQIKLESSSNDGINQHCMYIDGNDVCLYDLNSVTSSTVKKEKSQCNQLCSVDSIFNTLPEFEKSKSLFYLELINDDMYYIKNLNNQYLCNSNNKIILSENKNSNCIWNL
jgi:hypothetical protein